VLLRYRVTRKIGLAQFKVPGYGSIGAVAGVLLLSIATFIWFRADSFQRAFRRSPTLDVAFVGLTVLALPYYLIRSRGLKAGLMAIGAGLSIYVLYALATVMGVLFVRVVGAYPALRADARIVFVKPRRGVDDGDKSPSWALVLYSRAT
jgi:hypothetical protein